MKEVDTSYQLKMIAVLDFVVLALGIIGAAGINKIFGLGDSGPFVKGHPGFLSLAVAAIALITFFGVLRLGQSTKLPSEAQIRRAIALAAVTVYFVIVSVAAFYVPWAEEFSDVSRTLINSFTAIVSVIVAFFFGSSAYIEARRKEKQEDNGTAQQTK